MMTDATSTRRLVGAHGDRTKEVIDALEGLGYVIESIDARGVMTPLVDGKSVETTRIRVAMALSPVPGSANKKAAARPEAQS